MVIQDPIADLLIRIKNAGDAGRDVAVMPHSKLRVAVLDLLAKEGYIAGFSKKGKKAKKTIEVNITYSENRDPKIKGVSRVSRLSQRVYYSVKDIKPVKNNYGLLVLSTPKGIMTGEQARKEHVGGEALFKIW